MVCLCDYFWLFNSLNTAYFVFLSLLCNVLGRSASYTGFFGKWAAVLQVSSWVLSKSPLTGSEHFV